jgi:osmotically-inducible protein OsmY
MEGCLMGSVSRGDIAKVLATETRAAAGIRADTDLITEMKARLAQEAWVSNRRIWIAAKNGVISLFGMIDNKEEKTALGLMARTIAGCKGIENNLFPRTLLPGRGHWL